MISVYFCRRRDARLVDHVQTLLKNFPELRVNIQKHLDQESAVREITANIVVVRRFSSSSLISGCQPR